MKFTVSSNKRDILDAYQDIDVTITMNGLQAAFLKVMVERISDKAMLELIERGNSVREGELARLLRGKDGIRMASIMKPHEWNGVVSKIDAEASKLI